MNVSDICMCEYIYIVDIYVTEHSEYTYMSILSCRVTADIDKNSKDCSRNYIYN